MLSPSLEDYLEEVYRLVSTGQSVHITHIASILSVSLPSVVKGLKKLHDEEYIIYFPHHPIQLTLKGKVMGQFLVHRNHLLQQFLNMIDSHCDIEKEAEALEHYLSLPTLTAIQQLIDFMESHPRIYLDYRNYLQNQNHRDIIKNNT